MTHQLQRRALSQAHLHGVPTVRAGEFEFRRKAIASAVSLVLGASLLASGSGYAADEASSAAQQAENTQLRPEGQAAEVTPQAQPDNKPQAAAKESDALDAVVVTSRNREEIAQDVPLPITVLGGSQLDRDRSVEIQDLTRKAPGLTATTPNARRTGVSIRGIGKTSGNDNMEAAVGTIVDGVYLSHVGMTYQDFTDLDRVEILRGPQGTLLGKNTTLGAINYVSKAPKFTPEGLVEVELGHPNHSSGLDGAFKIKGSYTNALIDNLLAFRGSFFVDKQDGDIVNVNDESGDRFHEKNRWGGRAQFLLKPTDALSIKLNIDGAKSNEYSNTKPFMNEPATFADGTVRATTYTSRLSRAYFGGYTPIIGSWDKLDINNALPLLTENYGISSTVDWDLGPVILTSITAYRGFNFDANNDSDQTKFSINRGGTLVDTKQWSQELRLASPGGEKIEYQTGLYFLHTETDSTSRTLYGQDAGAFYASNGQYNSLYTAGNATTRAALKAALNNVYVTNKTSPETDSEAAYGQINWHLTDQATLTTGIRRTFEDKSSTIEKTATYGDGAALTSTGNATADAIRAAQVGTTYGETNGESIHSVSTSWLISPSYKLTPDVLLYASAAAGEKSASVQFNTSTGASQNVDPEKSLDFELGVKSLLLDRRLMFNVNFYHTRVRDYQATTSVVDETTTAQKNDGTTYFRSILGNIPEIVAKGVEVEGAYSVTSRLTFNFGGAYNHAIYTDWKNATCPAELNASSSTTCDNTGKQIVGAPRLTGIIGADYRVPLIDGVTGHAFFSTVVRSSQNLEETLSKYGEQAGYSVTDAGVGVNFTKYKTDLNLVGKNIFDTKYTTSVNKFSSTSPVGYDGIGPRRYLGVLLRTTF